MTERVLVTGGTGTTGRRLAERLRARGVGVAVGTRRPSGEDQVRFDWFDPTSFAPALDGVDAIYLVAPTDRVAQLSAMRPFLGMAVERTPGPLVLLSAASLPQGAPMMGEVQAWLDGHAPCWASLRPSWFMQNFTGQWRTAIIEEGRLYSATGDGRVAFIDAGDIAAVAAEALLTPERWSGELLLTGPRALSYDEAAALITEVTGRPVSHCRLSVEALAARYRGFGLPPDYAALLAGMDGEIARGSEDRTTDMVERITERRPTTLRAFFEANLAELSPL